MVSQTERLPSFPYRVKALRGWIMPAFNAAVGIYMNNVDFIILTD